MKNVARTPARSSRSSSDRVVGTTRAGSVVPPLERQRAADAADVEPFLEVDGKGVLSVRRPRIARATAGVIGFCGSGCEDELGDGVHRSQHPHAGLLVGDRHAERALDLEHELEHVDRIEPEAVGEERRGVADLLGRDRQPETADDAPA